jgi:hypothetical protein
MTIKEILRLTDAEILFLVPYVNALRAAKAAQDTLLAYTAMKVQTAGYPPTQPARLNLEAMEIELCDDTGPTLVVPSNGSVQ